MAGQGPFQTQRNKHGMTTRLGKLGCCIPAPFRASLALGHFEGIKKGHIKLRVLSIAIGGWWSATLVGTGQCHSWLFCISPVRLPHLKDPDCFSPVAPHERTSLGHGLPPLRGSWDTGLAVLATSEYALAQKLHKRDACDTCRKSWGSLLKLPVCHVLIRKTCNFPAGYVWYVGFNQMRTQ